jgi:hypothetical protein
LKSEQKNAYNNHRFVGRKASNEELVEQLVTNNKILVLKLISQ